MWRGVGRCHVGRCGEVPCGEVWGGAMWGGVGRCHVERCGEVWGGAMWGGVGRCHVERCGEVPCGEVWGGAMWGGVGRCHVEEGRQPASHVAAWNCGGGEGGGAVCFGDGRLGRPCDGETCDGETCDGENIVPLNAGVRYIVCLGVCKQVIHTSSSYFPPLCLWDVGLGRWG